MKRKDINIMKYLAGICDTFSAMMETSMLETIGWIGGFLLASCGLPQAIKSYRQKHSCGLSIWFLLMWLMGEVFVLIYVIPKWHWPLIFNYAANIVLVLIILHYKLYPARPALVEDGP